MKAGFERIGHTVTIERAQRSCLDKKRYPSRNHARDAAARQLKKFPTSGNRWWYCCSLCHGWHLTSKPPAGLKRASRKNNDPKG